VLHEPHAPLGRVIADDPVQGGAAPRCSASPGATTLRKCWRAIPGAFRAFSREVLEMFLMLANDPSWETKLKHGVRAGLSADAAVERVRGEHRAKFNKTRDPYLRERLHDLEDLDNRLLRALAGVDGAPAQELPADAILVARELGPAELLDYGAERLKGVALEEGGATAHAAIVARALGIPMVGLLAGAAFAR
jgi:phosphotransferase system enzyme I (PtsP)